MKMPTARIVFGNGDHLRVLGCVHDLTNVHPDTQSFRAAIVEPVSAGTIADGDVSHVGWRRGPTAWITFAQIAYMHDDVPLLLIDTPPIVAVSDGV